MPLVVVPTACARASIARARAKEPTHPTVLESKDVRPAGHNVQLFKIVCIRMLNNSSLTRFVRPFVYFLFSWGSPVYVSDSLYGCVVYARLLSHKWGNPLPEGAITCVGYRPGGEPGIDFDSADFTELVLKSVSDGPSV